MLNPFKKRKTAEPKSEKPEALKPASAPAPSARPKEARRIIGVIITPHLTEKTSAGSAKGWYTFRVEPHANRIMVKRAVEDRYAVGVERVRILYQRPKKMRLGRIQGQTPGFKKAMVKVRAGQSIEFT